MRQLYVEICMVVQEEFRIWENIVSVQDVCESSSWEDIVMFMFIVQDISDNIFESTRSTRFSSHKCTTGYYVITLVFSLDQHYQITIKKEIRVWDTLGSCPITLPRK